MIVAPGSTGISVTFQLVDDAGLPLTGLAIGDMPSIRYIRAGEATTVITKVALLNTAAEWESGGIAAYADGDYRLDIPNEAFATACNQIHIVGAGTGQHLFCEPIQCGYPPVNAAQLGGNTQSATDLRDFADTCYDPATHKVETVKVADNMRGTDGALLSGSYTAPDNSGISSAAAAAASAASSSSAIATILSGITSLASWLGLIAGKTADASTLAEINATDAGVSYDNADDSLQAIRDRGDIAWSSGSGGTGSVLVDQDYGGTNNLRATDSNGAGLGGVVFRAYLTSDYDAGNTGDAFVLGSTTTLGTGAWSSPMSLDPETYSLVGSPPNGYETVVTSLVVS